jgi:hypothetical protein
MMKGFQLRTRENVLIRFHYYSDWAPKTAAAFHQQLPFSVVLFHARVSGQEIWSDAAPALDTPQENASVFTEPGEVVISPYGLPRNKTAGCFGIYYGEGRGLDACNIFAAVFPEDLPLLKQLGEDIWKKGERELLFEVIGNE